jgi:hypothetical protein
MKYIVKYNRNGWYYGYMNDGKLALHVSKEEAIRFDSVEEIESRWGDAAKYLKDPYYYSIEEVII